MIAFTVLIVLLWSSATFYELWKFSQIVDNIPLEWSTEGKIEKMLISKKIAIYCWIPYVPSTWKELKDSFINIKLKKEIPFYTKISHKEILDILFQGRMVNRRIIDTIDASQLFSQISNIFKKISSDPEITKILDSEIIDNAKKLSSEFNVSNSKTPNKDDLVNIYEWRRSPGKIRKKKIYFSGLKTLNANLA